MPPTDVMSHAQGSSSLEYRVGDQPVPGYRLIRELGRGAMGVVWLAQTDSGFDRALKVINLRQRGGKKEYRGLRTIKQRKLLHGNLLTLIDYWLKDASGQTIPDSDDLENTDSFFAPKGSPPGPLGLTQTTPQSITATDTAPKSPTQRPPLPAQRAQTMVSRETIVWARCAGSGGLCVGDFGAVSVAVMLCGVVCVRPSGPGGLPLGAKKLSVFSRSSESGMVCPEASLSQ